MIRIVVVEDSDADFQRLKNYIDVYALKRGVRFEVRRYSSALLFLSEYKSDADIIFMDIELPDINGVLASEKLRLKDENVALVFVTNLAHLAIKGYAVSAVDFIVKPLDKNKFFALLSKLIKSINARRDDFITLAAGHGLERVSLSQIVYIEAEAHRIKVHLVDRILTFSGTLTACEKLLPGDTFVRCYQSFIVNIKYVTSFKGTDILLNDGTVIPVSRSKKHQVMQSIALYFSGGGW